LLSGETSASPATEDPPAPVIKAVKSVKLGYTPTPLTRDILETFRKMVNKVIQICLCEGIKGRLTLRDRVYKEFQQ
jgi:hypothetical protein